MSETPTEPPVAKSGGVRLPVLPEGWEYEVKISGPEKQVITVSRFGGVAGPGVLLVEVQTGIKDSGSKTIETDSLADGVKQGVGLVRTLRDLAEHEKRSAAAREAFLSQIGSPSPKDEDTSGEPAIVVTASSPEGLDEAVAKAARRVDSGGAV